MSANRRFKETTQARAGRDPEFREQLAVEGIECLLSGDLEPGKAALRNCINAAAGFPELGRLTGKAPKSLTRMFGPRGDPQARNLLEVLRGLQEREGFRLKARCAR